MNPSNMVNTEGSGRNWQKILLFSLSALFSDSEQSSESWSTFRKQPALLILLRWPISFLQSVLLLSHPLLRKRYTYKFESIQSFIIWYTFQTPITGMIKNLLYPSICSILNAQSTDPLHESWAYAVYDNMISWQIFYKFSGQKLKWFWRWHSIIASETYLQPP